MSLPAVSSSYRIVSLLFGEDGALVLLSMKSHCSFACVCQSKLLPRDGETIWPEANDDDETY